MRALSIFIICIALLLPSTLYPASNIYPVNAPFDHSKEVYQKMASLKVKEIQTLIGRKLTVKEKVSLWVFKHTSAKPAEGKKGNTAFIFGLVGIGLLVLGLFVPYIILGAIAAAIVAVILGSNAKKLDPSDGKARAAVLLGWITIGATALLLILAAIVVASWGVY